LKRCTAQHRTSQVKKSPIELLSQWTESIKPGILELKEKVDNLNKKASRERNSQRMELLYKDAESLIGNAERLGDISIVISRVDGLEMHDLRKFVDVLRSKLKKGVVVLGSVMNDKAYLVCGVDQCIRYF